MKKQFWKKSKWILTGFIAAIVITTCTAYSKEKDEVFTVVLSLIDVAGNHNQ